MNKALNPKILYLNRPVSFRWLSVLLIVVIPSLSIAQTSQEYIRVISRAHKDSVVIRWAPSTPAAWKFLNQYGYKVERYTIMRDGAMLNPKPMVVLSDGIKPAQRPQWEFWMDRDDFVAVSAQAIFGEEFKLDVNQNDIMQIYNKVVELESRYSFALFAADISAKAASLSGLHWVDKDVKSNEMYLYRVYSKVPDAVQKIEFGFAYTGPAEAVELPQPRMPEIENTSETSVIVRWETSTLSDVYTAYFLERSTDDGKSFARVNKVPMTILQSPGGQILGFSSQSDTLIVGVKTLYRVRGRNSFGEEGPPSESLIFIGEGKFAGNPANLKTTVTPGDQIKLTWQFPKEHLHTIKGFEVERSNEVSTGYRVINKGLIPPSQTEYLDTSPLSTSYYRIVAVSPKGMRSTSFAHLVQLEDSIPPSPPKGLKAVVDTAGIVTITWAKNTESDLLGYRVFRSAFKNSEFSQVTVSPTEYSTFIDTVNVKTLSRNMFYKLTALDNRFNPSGFSETIQLELPDVIPPVSPAIRSVRSREEGVEIRWVNSASMDVIEHHVLRKKETEDTWVVVKKLIRATDTTLVYIDKPQNSDYYQYAMIAVDKAGLKSPMTNPLRAHALPKTPAKIEYAKISADRDNKVIRIVWKYTEADVQKFLIYRSVENAPLTMYKSVGATAYHLEDKDPTMNSVYVYRIKAVFKDGRESHFSDELKIKF